MRTLNDIPSTCQQVIVFGDNVETPILRSAPVSSIVIRDEKKDHLFRRGPAPLMAYPLHETSLIFVTAEWHSLISTLMHCVNHTTASHTLHCLLKIRPGTILVGGPTRKATRCI